MRLRSCYLRDVCAGNPRGQTGTPLTERGEREERERDSVVTEQLLARVCSMSHYWNDVYVNVCMCVRMTEIK